MKIRKYIDFLKEAISGTEMVGPVGPAFGETRLQNKTINSFDTELIYSEIGDRIYTIDEYNQMYQDYLKAGGEPLNGFSKENLDTIVYFFNNKQE
jgi:hypothetical protein